MFYFFIYGPNISAKFLFHRCSRCVVFFQLSFSYPVFTHQELSPGPIKVAFPAKRDLSLEDLGSTFEVTLIQNNYNLPRLDFIIICKKMKTCKEFFVQNFTSRGD